MEKYFFLEVWRVELSLRHNTFFSQDDNCWIADSSQLKLGGGFGSTPEEAIADFEIVFDMYCKTQAEDGEPLPIKDFNK